MADGLTAATTYNHMLLPMSYGDPEAEYRRLTEGVSMWDVGCQRQVEVRGPDADRLAQTLCPRHLTDCAVGQGKYVPVCNHRGTVINDPVVLRVDEECFWFSIADSDMGLWASCVAAERGLDVLVREPDVSPLAIQGPLAAEVAAALVGEWVRDLPYFWFADAEVDGIPVKLARSGWSKQGGFELYLLDGSRGLDLWAAVKAAGRTWGIGPGCPTTSERVESGLLSWGGDTDADTNPFEVRLGRLVDLDVPDEVIGIGALREIAARGPRRHQLGVVMDGEQPRPSHGHWCDIVKGGVKVGDLTNGTWSYRLQRNIGFGLVAAHCRPDDEVEVALSEGAVAAKLVALPFV